MIYNFTHFARFLIFLLQISKVFCQVSRYHLVFPILISLKSGFVILQPITSPPSSTEKSFYIILVSCSKRKTTILLPDHFLPTHYLYTSKIVLNCFATFSFHLLNGSTGLKGVRPLRESYNVLLLNHSSVGRIARTNFEWPSGTLHFFA